MKLTVLIVLFASVLGVSWASTCQDTFGTNYYCDGYCCGDACCDYTYDDSGLDAGYIVLIVAIIIVKIFFWTCCCYYWRRRRYANVIVVQNQPQGPYVASVATVSNQHHVGYTRPPPQQFGAPPPYSAQQKPAV